MSVVPSGPSILVSKLTHGARWEGCQFDGVGVNHESWTSHHKGRTRLDASSFKRVNGRDPLPYLIVADINRPISAHPAPRRKPRLPVTVISSYSALEFSSNLSLHNITQNGDLTLSYACIEHGASSALLQQLS